MLSIPKGNIRPDRLKNLPCLAGMLLFSLLPAWLGAQQTDSILIKRGSVLQYPDTAVVLRRDTFLTTSDTAGLHIRSGFFTRFFYNFIKIGDMQIENIYQGLRDFEDIDAPYIGKTVGNIRLVKLDPFGTDLLNPSYYNENWVVKTGNLLHITTRDRVVLNNLYFFSGDALAPFEIGDSERQLREQPFIKDARIYVEERPVAGDTVDVRVVTKDIWSLIINLNFPEKGKMDLVFNERNFLGLGLELIQDLRFDLNDRLGYQGLFRLPNVLGSYTSAEIAYSNLPGLSYYGGNVAREFITPDIRYGGGLDHSWISKADTLYPPNETIYTNDIGFRETGIWFGYNIPINRRARADRRAGIIPAIGYRWHNFFERPETETDSLLYQDRQLYIGSLTFTRRQFFTDNLLLGFGRTEDIPSGLLLEITAGYEAGESVDRPYGSARVLWAKNTRRAGYFSTQLSFGGFFPGDRIEQGMIGLQQQFFSRLVNSDRKIKQRSILVIDVIRGINRLPNEIRRIDNRFGIRGLNSDSLRGQSSMTFSYNHLFFTSWRPLGFRFAPSLFADLGYISQGNDPPFSGRPYWSFGPSMEFNNENFIFGSLIFRFSFHPAPPEDASFFSFSLSFTQNLRFRNLNPRPPGVLPYKSTERYR